MPQIRLTVYSGTTAIPVQQPAGGALFLPRYQLRCWTRLPGGILPKDGIIDTGSPFSWFPEEIWSALREGADFEWLPFPPGYRPPVTRTAGWSFRFRVARLLAPVGLFDLSMAAELTRDAVIVQFADGNPPKPPGSKRPAFVVLGLWGGVLEGTRLHITADPATGAIAGALEF